MYHVQCTYHIGQRTTLTLTPAQLREAAVADYKLDHRAWAMQREQGPQLRAELARAWALYRAGRPNDYVRG